MHHEPTLEATAGAVPGVEAEVKAGVMAGLIARVILGVALGVDDHGPLADLHLGGGWPSENLRWSQTPKEVWRTTCQNPLFQMWKHG